jgi:phospholipase C
MSRLIGLIRHLSKLGGAILRASAHDHVARAQSFPDGISNVFVIVLENHNWSEILGNPSTPYINSLLTRDDASYASQYFNPPGVHPSEPNYIWMEAGDNTLPSGSDTLTFNTDNDPSPVYSTSTTDHLTTYLNAAGISWKAYAEGAPGTSYART